jgi:hypothetical protein
LRFSETGSIINRRMNRFLPAAILLAGLAGAVAVSGRPAGGSFPEPSFPKPVGLAGCASSNCHGRSGGDTFAVNAWQTSCIVWAARDPHARASDVLDPQKNSIAKKMQAAFARQDPGYHPQKDARCLACHANPGIEKGDKPELVTLRAEGVGCEACHGNAEDWLHTHTQAKLADRHGLAELNDLGSRAKTCAGCHVGGPGRDMNHDMIAAGHPKLNFEFASHLARMPKHWIERDRRTGGARGPDFLAVAWLSGVSATGEAVCQLSIDRQSRQSPWPELAEWNCYACHHDLLGKQWRSEAGFKLDTKAWNFPWPLGDEAAAEAAQNGLGRKAAEWTRAVNGALGDNRIDVLRAALAGLAEGRKPGRRPADATGAMLAAVEATKSPPDWDTAYRMYLTLGVLEFVRRDTKKTENAAIAAALKDVEKALNLPDHPKEATYDPKAVQAAIQKLTAELRVAWGK